MVFHQLHYTSCESGLSGHSGFQFCAMTPGVQREVIREVERLTVYEPPRYLVSSEKPVSIDDYPTNLLFAFSQQTGVIIIARIVYVGVDFSNRAGNYFAHALVGDTLGDGPQPLLPVELWEAPFWSSRPGEHTELPTLPDSLPTGPINREAVSGLPGAEHETAFGLLLAAVDQAMTGGQQVLLVDVDTAAVCGWIAAACYLLGPELASRLPFATFRPDPRRCPTHVIGAVDATGPFRADITANTRLFNFTQGIFPEVAPCPSASLVARIGVAASAALWELVAALAPSSAVSLSASFPILASAALLLEHKLTAAEIDTAIGWLASPVNAPAAEHRATAVRAALRHPLDLLSVQRQTDLVSLALQADMTSARSRHALASRVECALIDGTLTRLDRGERPGEVVTDRKST